ncbi:PREDICTED: putative F-box protein PP2-B12 isoform X2 [Nelumbo nucifera]|uniref:F-box protein PP2-B12 n=2 Tax=Nelumbo nucifera TaxID=4432 RepID=A0A822XYP4_NELNU|nr:PREDICTED: putative F-box protein PP2-B12 isoform X2 [Nelumbo nucifera]DAD23885.1 TPA_asm: hypothetical protein HUJ06_025348 [Nelumbo nucifera]
MHADRPLSRWSSDQLQSQTSSGRGFCRPTTRRYSLDRTLRSSSHPKNTSFSISAIIPFSSTTATRCSGKKSFMIAARELSIVWGDVPQYWRWRSLPNSRFSEVAELLNVRWLEIHGRMERRMLSTATNYVAYLVLKFVEGGRGLDTQPAEASVRFVGGGGACNGPRNVFLKPNTYGQQRPSIEERLGYLRNTTQLVSRLLQIAEGQFPREREDGWMEIQMGEFFNGPGEDGEVEMSLMEVKGGHWKSGIIIQGIELRPKQSK